MDASIHMGNPLLERSSIQTSLGCHDLVVPERKRTMFENRFWERSIQMATAGSHKRFVQNAGILSSALGAERNGFAER